jgi:hypothetical protein
LRHRWRTDAKQGDIGPIQRQNRIRGRREVATFDRTRYEFIDARFDDRAPPRTNMVDLYIVDIDATHLMAS